MHNFDGQISNKWEWLFGRMKTCFLSLSQKALKENKSFWKKYEVTAMSHVVFSTFDHTLIFFW